MTQNKHSNACLVLLQAQNNFGAVHIVLDRLKKIFNLDMVQNVEFGSEIMFDLVQIENLFWNYPILEEQGITLTLKKYSQVPTPSTIARIAIFCPKIMMPFFRTKRI